VEGRVTRRAEGPGCRFGRPVRAALWLGVAVGCALLPLGARALSSSDLRYQIAVDLRPGAEGPPEHVLRIREGEAARDLVESVPSERLLVGHLEELSGTLFLIAEGPGSMIGAFSMRLEDDAPVLFVDAAAPYGGTRFLPELSASDAASVLLTESDGGREILLTRFSEASRVLGSGDFERGLVESAFEVGLDRKSEDADVFGLAWTPIDELANSP
jgi:hypothetical protein